MMKWYDTLEGIRGSIQTLAGFNKLIEERKAAGYERQEELNEFVVFGHFHLYSCGNCGVDENNYSVNTVLCKEDFWKEVGSSVVVRVSIRGKIIPLATDVCPECKKGWDITNCHDMIIRDDVCYHKECNEINLEEGVLSELVSCLDCDKSWNDIYKLVNITEN